MSDLKTEGFNNFVIDIAKNIRIFPNSPTIGFSKTIGLLIFSEEY